MIKHRFLVITLLFWAVSLKATTYYMRADGTATQANATSCSAASTAMSPATHNSGSFNAGDTIIICDSGGTYRTGTATLTPPSAGSSGSPITYTNSGSPSFNGSDVITGWTSLPNPNWAYYNSAAGFTTTTNYTYTLSLGFTAAANSLLVTGCYYHSGTYTPTISDNGSDTGGTSWTQLGNAQLYATSGYTAYVWGRNIGGSGTGPTSITCSLGSGNTVSMIGIVAANYTGVPNPFVLDGSVVQYNFSTTTPSRTITTGPSGDMLLSQIMTTSSAQTSMSVASPFTLEAVDSGHHAGQSDDGANSTGIGAATSQTVTYTLGNTMQGALFLEAFEAPLTLSGNVYMAPLATKPYAVYFNGSLGVIETSIAGLTANNEWFWAANYLYVYESGGTSGMTIEATSRICINIGQNYITLQNVSCTKGQQQGIEVTSQYDTIQNTTVSAIHMQPAVLGAGIYINNGQHDIVINNTISDADVGVFENAASGSIVGNYIGWNVLSNIYANAVDTYVAASQSLGQDTIEHNICINAAQVTADTGCVFEGGTSGSTVNGLRIVRYNLSVNAGVAATSGWAFDIDVYETENTEYYNIAYGSQVAGLNVCNPSGLTAYNNTLYQNTQKNSSGNGEIAFCKVSTSAIFNNNLAQALTGAASDLVFISSANEDSQVFDYNLYYGGPSSPFTWGSALNFSGWQGVPQDIHGWFLIPGLLNISGTPTTIAGACVNFYPLMSSSTIGRGKTISSIPAIDFCGNPVIPGHVTIGAVQFQPRPAVGAVM